jgi:hypothetical protein
MHGKTILEYDDRPSAALAREVIARTEIALNARNESRRRAYRVNR